MINFKYIKTKVNDRNVILQFNNCNICPLMKFDKNNLNVVCSFCENKKIESVNGYSVHKGVSVPFNKVNIPKWCHLPSNIIESQNSNYVYSKYTIDKYYIQFDEKVLPIINNNVVELDHTHYRIKIKNEYKQIIDKYIFNDENNDENKKIKKDIILNKCSCCGQNKEKINRYENLGMCDECWEKNKKDNFTKYFSYINNFRLKRNKDWIDKNFNKIDINFNIK